MDITYTIALITFVALAIYWLFIKPIIDYSIWISWWDQNNGSQYDCIDIIAISYYNSNYLVYYLYNLIQKGTSRFETDSQVKFITNMINSYAYGIASGGKLVPKNLCDTIVPQQRINGQGWPTNFNDWHTLISDWAGSTGANWNSQDNFLWNDWTIDYDSPIVQAFITRKSEYEGQVWYPDALEFLLQTNGKTGSFVGMMQYITSANTSAGDFDNILWSQIPDWYSSNQNTGALPPGAKCNPVGVAGSVLSSITSGIFVGAMIPPPGNPVGIIAGLLVAGVGSVIGAAQHDCFSK